MTPRLGPGCSSCFRNGVSRSLWDVEGPWGPCWQPAAVLCPVLGRGGHRSPFRVTAVVSCHCRTNNPGSCPKKGKEPFLTNLFRKLFRERETNISLHNPFRHFAVFTTIKYWGFSPLNPWLLLIPHFPTVSLQSVLTGFSQDTSKILTSSNEAFFHDFFSP